MKTNAPASNLSPAAIGQAKHMAAMALEALEDELPETEYDALEAAVADIVNLAPIYCPPPPPGTPIPIPRGNRVLLVGQLKALAQPFYDHLRAWDSSWLDNEMISANLRVVEPGSNPPEFSPYPWSVATSDDQNYAIATLGQLKAVFSLRFEYLPDDDGDQLPDAWEVQYGLDPLDDGSDNPGNGADGDPDNDGLSNLQEYQNGTDPKNSDTDGDQLSDGWEVQYGTNPNRADTDGDQLPDAWEIQYGLDPLDDGSDNPDNGPDGDPDNDGLSNHQEYQNGTDPKNADTDGDQLPDAWEVQYGLDPLDDGSDNPGNGADGDPDSDGLSNFQEYQNGTDPKNSDTDGDQLSDGWEVQYGTNPKNADTDGDQLPDGWEVQYGTNPNRADTDGDQLPDAWEVQYGLDPLDDGSDNPGNGADGDPDNDGLSNLQEYQNGTDPMNPDTDGDLLLDGWESQFGDGSNGLDPLQANPNAWSADWDSDGFSNLLESIYGSDPFDSSSHPPSEPADPPIVIHPPYPPDEPEIITPPPPPSITGTGWHLVVDESSKTLSKYGYAEFIPSAPPKRYLKLSETVAFELTGDDGDPPESPINGTKTTTIDPLTGEETVVDGQHDGNNNMGGATEAITPTMAASTTEVSSYDDEPNRESDRDATKTYAQHLVSENTTEKLLANTMSELPEYTGEFQAGSPSAYRDLGDEELSFQYKRVKCRVEWDEDVPAQDRSVLRFLLIFQPEAEDGSSEEPSPEVVEVVELADSEVLEIDPESRKPGEDGSYFLLPVEVSWKAIDGFENVDDHVDPWNKPIYGKRIFPEFKNPDDTEIRHKLEVIVKTSPSLFGKTVYVKSFDVDDSTSDDFDLDENGTAPVIDTNGKAGDDNLTDYLYTPQNGQFWTGSAWGGQTAQGTVDANGETKFIFRVGMQPGSNYRVVASVIDETMYAGIQTSNPAAAKYLGPEANQTGGTAASPLLTVWRRLWVENDSMEAHVRNDLFSDKPDARIHHVWPNETTNHTSFLFEAPTDSGSFMNLENGRIVAGNTSHEVLATGVATGQSVFANVAGLVQNVGPGDDFRLYDDDDFGLNRAPLPRNDLIDDTFKNVYKPAFIEVVDAADFKGLDYNPSKTVDFYRNHPVMIGPWGFQSPGVWDDAINLTDSKPLWVGNLIAGYQGEVGDDRDPSSEDLMEGITPGSRRYSIVYVENVRDLNDAVIRNPSADNTAMNHEIERNIKLTAAHEIGHMPGGGNETSDHAENMLMGEDGYGNGFNFSPKSILRFRKTNQWQQP